MEDLLGNFKNRMLPMNDLPFSIDIDETEQGMIITAQLPQDIKREQIKLHLQKGWLMIMIESREEIEERNELERYIRLERSVGRVGRSVPLPKGVTTKGAKVNFQNGLLTIRLTKKRGYL